MSEQAIVGLAVLLFALPFLGAWMKHRLDHSTAAAERRLEHTRELEDRVRMLERIVTAKGFDVATQIEALRDASAAPNRTDKELSQ